MHRDLKPTNILLAGAAEPLGAEGGDGSGARGLRVKIVDFGLATLMGGSPLSSMDGSFSSTSSGGSSGSGSGSTSSNSAQPSDPVLQGTTASCVVLGSGDSSGGDGTGSSSSSSTGSSGSGGSRTGVLKSTPTAGAGTAADGGEGLARQQTSSTSQHTSGVGTASYAAPEQLEGGGGGGGGGCGGDYSSAVDLFSAGLILMELFCRFETGGSLSFGGGTGVAAGCTFWAAGWVVG